jgi:hypothetical protein
VTARTPCDEIAADAAALAALPAGALERARAEEHARTCAPCARALDEGQRLLAALAAATLPAPTPAALERAKAAVLAELDAEAGARGWAGRLALGVAAAVVAAWAVPLALAKAPIATGAPFALSLGLAALAAVATVATVRWGGRLAVVFPLLSALTALAVGRGPSLDAAGGLHCALVEGMTAAGVGVAAWLLGRAFARTAPRARLVVAGVGGGALAGHAALHLACGGATELPHVLAFHTGPVALVVALALVVAGGVARPTTDAG